MDYVFYIEGILKIANVILAVVAGGIAITIFRVSHHRGKTLKPWKFLTLALVFFAFQEIFGALRSFKIYEHPYLTHIIPTIIIAFVLTAIILETNIVGRK
ncbi:MAG: hypothetical protein ABIJ08_01165 [Nanoarchaeota archaeon]